MIHWLMEAATADPDLAQGQPPRGLLSAAEQTRFAALKSDKRKRDWLLGRWTAKRLVQTVLAGRGVRASAVDVVIDNQESGEPYLAQPAQPLSLSISHAHGHAVCALVEQADCRLGVDLELVEPRSAEFVASYCTPVEQAALAAAPPQLHPLLATAVWSAKEAALKALGKGLTVSTHAVTCHVQASTPPQEWTPFAVELNTELLGTPAPDLNGWWRSIAPFVLTIVIERNHV